LTVSMNLTAIRSVIMKLGSFASLANRVSLK
jgi:hypothetical protein